MVSYFARILRYSLLSYSRKENARVVMYPGKNRDGYLTNVKVREQLLDAIRIAKAKYPEEEHVFIYDNATVHTKRREDAPSATNMTLGPSKNYGEIIGVDAAGQKLRIRTADTTLKDGSQQSFYFPEDHPKYPGYFKGATQILRERNINTTGLKLMCPKFKCDPKISECCARRILFNEPDFANPKSALEEIAESHGCQVLFLPKFHCELNPIEQCWGYAKRVYRQFPPSRLDSDLKANMLASLNTVPVESIRR